MSKYFVAVSAFALLLAIGTPALADELAAANPDILTVTVSYSDLDVATIKGATTLKSRIETAAAAACGGAPYMMDLKANQIYRECMKASIAEAVLHSGLPTLASLYGTPVAFAQR